MTDPEALTRAHDRIRSTWPDLPIGAVFANAGVIFNHTILRSTVEEWRTTLDVNVLGVFQMVRAVRPAMVDSGGGSIVNISSQAGATGTGSSIAYAAAKGAVKQTRRRVEGCLEAETRRNVHDIADLTGTDDLHQPRDLRMAAIHECLHEEDTFLLGDLRDRRDLTCGHTGRLFAQHALSGAQRHDRELRVEWMGRRHINRVNLGIGDEGIIGRIPLRIIDAIGVSKGGAPAFVATCDRGQ